jgi:NAD(P)-dependent dehydrogenase (short-subunit alcohol dehydrogenase family)
MAMSGSRLEGRHILITGGASDMDYTTAELFMAEAERQLGAIDTPMLRASLSGGYGLDTSGFALQRIGQPLEIAQGVLYLTSDESSYVTGVALAIDGGRSFH